MEPRPGTLTGNITQKLRVTQRAMERSMIGVTRRDKWKNIGIRETTGVIDIINHIKRSKLKVGRSYSKARTKKMNITHNSMDTRYGYRSRGRPSETWDSDLYKWKGSTWGRLAANRSQWASHAEAYAQQWAESRLTLTIPSRIYVHRSMFDGIVLRHLVSWIGRGNGRKRRTIWK